MTPPAPAQNNSTAEAFDTDVLILGAGPVGLTLANLLGGYGVSTVLADAGDKLIDYPRGVGLDDESLRTFQTAGVVDAVLPHTTPNHIMRMVNGKGQVLANVAPGAQDYGWSRRNGFIQPLVDAELLKGLSRFDHVDVRFSHTLLGYVDDADGVTATIELADGSQKTIRARYLVGCDGGRSITRKSMGVSFEGQSSPTRFLVIDVRNDPLGTPNAYLGADPVRPFVSIGLPHGVRRFEYMIFDHETDEQVADPLFVHQLLARHVPDPAGLDFIRQRVYTLHARIAGAFRKGHVLIAGDAAHLMPVWQGQGYNSGVRDATNLAWKLTAILRGIADDALLDTYDTERRDHAKAMIDVSVAMGRILSPTNKAVAGGRDKIAAALNLVPAAKKWIAEGRYKPKPRFHVGALVEAVGPAGEAQPVGSMFPQPRVDTRTEQNVLLDDVLGPWFSVLVWGNDPRHVFDQNSLDTLTRLGVKLISIRPSTQLHWDAAPTGDPREAAADVTVIGDSTGRLKSWFDTHPVGFVIVRPDRYVAAAALAQHGSTVVSSLATAIHLTPEITMSLALVAMSHSPLLELSEPPAELTADVETAFAAARKFIAEYDPELVVVFGPDHYNGFFYELMPQFCIGLAATSIGDFGSTPGSLDVPRDIAEGLAQAVLDSGVDLAVSLRMEVDHGMVQPLEILFGGLTAVPVVPFFINSVAPPFTPVHRVRALGEALGRYLSSLDKRVLLIGSGGLSHEPPVPELATAAPAVVEGLIAGRNPTAEATAKRRANVINAAKRFAAGEGNLKDLNPEWDNTFLDQLAANDLDTIAKYSNDSISELGGKSGHEIRNWIAAYSALSTVGPYDITYRYYRPIPEFIAGFSVTTALPRTSG